MRHRRGRLHSPITSLLLMSSDFDIHDSVADTASVQDPDRFIFSNENVAGDPTQYTRADDLADYVLDKIVANDIPPSIARDAEIEAWALIVNSSTDIPSSKLPLNVSGISNFAYSTALRRLSFQTDFSDSTSLAHQVTFPEWATLADIADWAEEDQH